MKMGNSRIGLGRAALALGTLVALGGCATVPTYYLANVYRDNNDLYVERCPAYSSGKWGESSTLSNKDCLIEKVQELPPDARASLNTPPAPPASK